MLYIAKVRIDLSKMKELGQKLQSGELDRSKIKFTYCLMDDLAVGISLWETIDKMDFEKAFQPYRKYYKDIIEISEVVPSSEAQQTLMKQLA